VLGLHISEIFCLKHWRNCPDFLLEILAQNVFRNTVTHVTPAMCNVMELNFFTKTTNCEVLSGKFLRPSLFHDCDMLCLSGLVSCQLISLIEYRQC